MRWSVLLAVALAACSAAVPPDPRGVLTRAQIDALPAPVLYVAGPAAGVPRVLVEVGRNGSVSTWGDGAGGTVSLSGGVLTATRGLGADLMEADLRGVRPALASGRSGARYARRMGHLAGDGRLRTAAYACLLQAFGAERLALQGLSLPVTKWIETCEGTEHRFANIYWRDARGRIWRSEQWVGPEAGMIVLEHWSR